MAKHLSTSNFKKLPVGFLLALSAVFIFESLNVLFDKYLYNPPYDGLKVYIKNEISYKHENKLDFLVLGDCYAITGINPVEIEARSGLSGFNLALYVRSTIFSSYCFLKNYLATCARKPKYIILSFRQESCAISKENIEQALLPYFYDFKNKNEMSLIHEFGFKKAYVFLLPSLKHQYLFSHGFKGLGFLWSGRWGYSADEFSDGFTVQGLVEALRYRGIDMPEGSGLDYINDHILTDRDLYKKYERSIAAKYGQDPLANGYNLSKNELQRFNRSLIDLGDSEKSPQNPWSFLKDSDKVDAFIADIYKAKGFEETQSSWGFYLSSSIPQVEKFKVTGFFDKYLRAILDMARRNNIKVIYVMPTYYLEDYRAEEALGNPEAYQEYLQGLNIGNRFTVLFPEQDLKSKYLYANQQHLNFYGSLTLSADVATLFDFND